MRCLGASRLRSVKDAPASVADALTPGVLALVGRDLIRRGESVFQIIIERGTVRLAPVGSWDVRGGPDEVRVVLPDRSVRAER